MSFIRNTYQVLIIERPWFAALIIVLATAVAGFYAQNFKVDASADALVLEGDEDLEFYRGVIEKFGTSESLIVAYELVNPIMSDETLEAIGTLADDLGRVEGIDNVVTILDVPLLYSPKVSLASLADGLKNLRDPTVDRELVQKELADSPIYRQLLSSLDESTTVLQLNFAPDLYYRQLLENRERLRKLKLEETLTESSKQELVDAEQAFKDYAVIAADRQKNIVASVRAVIGGHKGSAKNIFLGGVPMIANDMVAFVMSDLQKFGLGIIAFIVALLTVIFRELRWVVLPMLACLVTSTLMFGVLGFFDWRMTVISSNFVALLLIITLAIAVHLVVRYRELEAANPDAPPKQLAMDTVTAMLRPCLYTVLTTIIAFVSLVISGIRPVIDFGWMMTAGVLLALTVAFLLVPAGMASGLGRPSTKSFAADSDASDAFTLKFASFSERFGRWVVVFAALLFVMAIAGVMQLKVENRFIDYFDESTEIYQGMELVDSQLGGTIPLDIILMPSALVDESEADDLAEFGEDGFDDFDEDFAELSDGEESFDDFGDDFASGAGDESAQAQWFTRAALDRVEQVHDHLDSLPQTGKVISLATLYKVAQDLLGSSVDDIQLSFAQRGLPTEIKDFMVAPYLHDESGQTRLSVRVKETSRSLNRKEFLAQLDEAMQDELGFAAEDYRFSGMLVLYNNMLQSLFASQILTLGAVFLAITAMLYVLFRKLSLALLGILPNLLAALIVLGSMGWFGLPLDLMTITIAAISIGIGVDNTIHYIYRYRTEIGKDGNYVAAMYRSHGSIGKAMYYTSLTIIFGFSILALSNFKPSIYFGLLTGAAMLSALLGALLLLPQLLILFKPFGSK